MARILLIATHGSEGPTDELMGLEDAVLGGTASKALARSFGQAVEAGDNFTSRIMTNHNS